MKKTLISGVVALIAFISSLFPYLRIDAQSQSFMFHIPTFSLYSASADTIQRGEVTYALDSFDPNTCKVTEKSVYHISATEGQTLELSIPFVSSAIDVPDFDVQVNGEAVNGTIRYGEKFVHYSDDFDLNVAFEKISSSELDASIISLRLNKIPLLLKQRFPPIKTLFTKPLTVIQAPKIPKRSLLL